MLATGTILIIWALILIIRDFIEETRYEKMRTNGMAGQPRQPQVMGTSGNTTYYNGYDTQNGGYDQNNYNNYSNYDGRK